MTEAREFRAVDRKILAEQKSRTDDSGSLSYNLCHL